MKKIVLSIIVILASIFAAGNAQAQMTIEFTTAPINPELETLAKQVIEKQYSDPDSANKIFNELKTKIQKNTEQATAVGKFFLDNNNYDCANICANAAYTIDKSYVPALMLRAGVCLLREQYGEAGAMLDEALYYEPKNVDLLLLNARVYMHVNPYASNDMYNQIFLNCADNTDLAISTAYEAAYNCEIVEFYTEALDWYDRYFELAGKNAIPACHLSYGIICDKMKNNYTVREQKHAMMLRADPHLEAYMNARPDDYLGPFRRAMLWSYEMSTPDKESIKWYKKTITCIDALPVESRDASMTFKLISLQLLALYYFNLNDKASVKLYADQILNIDPTNKVGVNLQKWANL